MWTQQRKKDEEEIYKKLLLPLKWFYLQCTELTMELQKSWKTLDKFYPEMKWTFHMWKQSFML